MFYYILSEDCLVCFQSDQHKYKQLPNSTIKYIVLNNNNNNIYLFNNHIPFLLKFVALITLRKEKGEVVNINENNSNSKNKNMTPSYRTSSS